MIQRYFKLSAKLWHEFKLIDRLTLCLLMIGTLAFISCDDAKKSSFLSPQALPQALPQSSRSSRSSRSPRSPIVSTTQEFEHQLSDQHQIIYTSTWILQEVIQQLIGNQAQTQLICPPDQDPAHYRPTQPQLVALQKAKLIILNGAHLEEGLVGVSLPLSRTFKSASHLRDQWLNYPISSTSTQHQHGPAGAHNHDGIDGHTWLDPHLLRAQMKAIKRRLKQAKFTISSDNSTRLEHKLTEIDQTWSEVSPLLQRHIILSNHPAYQYVARRYSLNIHALDLPPETPPNSQQLTTFKQSIKEFRSNRPQAPILMIWESPPQPEILKLLDIALQETLSKEEVLEEVPSHFIRHLTLRTLEQPPQLLDKKADPFLQYLNDLKEIQKLLSNIPNLHVIE